MRNSLKQCVEENLQQNLDGVISIESFGKKIPATKYRIKID